MSNLKFAPAAAPAGPFIPQTKGGTTMISRFVASILPTALVVTGCNNGCSDNTVSVDKERLGTILKDNWLELSSASHVEPVRLAPGEGSGLREALSRLLLQGGRPVEDTKSAPDFKIRVVRAEKPQERILVLFIGFYPLGEAEDIVEVSFGDSDEWIRFVGDARLMQRLDEELQKFNPPSGQWGRE